MSQHEIGIGDRLTLTLAWGTELPPEIDPAHRSTEGILEIRLSPVGGCLQGRREVVVEAAALEHFREAVSRLLNDLTGSATLEPVLDLGGLGDFAITVTLEHGKGAVSGFLSTRFHEARLTFDGIEIDQSYLHETHRQLRALLAAR